MNRKDISSDDSDTDEKNDCKVVVRSSDMSDIQQTEAARIIVEALTIHPKETQVAKVIKTHFDEKHGRSWQCVVGKHFAR